MVETDKGSLISQIVAGSFLNLGLDPDLPCLPLLNLPLSRILLGQLRANSPPLIADHPENLSHSSFPTLDVGRCLPCL